MNTIIEGVLLPGNQGAMDLPYHTPWCKMLGVHDTTNLLHLWYPIDELLKKIDMRTAYLGKGRRTNDTPHLLDLINMTEDERILFDDCLNTAAADMFDDFGKYTKNIGKSGFDIDRDSNVIDIEPLPEVSGTGQVISQDIAPDGKSITGNIWYQPAKPVPLGYRLECSVTIRYTTAYAIKDDPRNIFSKEETETISVPLFDSVVGGRLIGTINFHPSLDEETELLTSTTIQSIDQITIFPSASVYMTTVGRVLKEGDTVRYQGDAYRVLKDSTEKHFLESYDSDTFEALPQDFSHSVHYIIEFDNNLNNQYIQPLDIALEDALLNHIIANWLHYVYPDEENAWKIRTEEAKEKVRSRCHKFVESPAELVPRWF